MVWMLRTRGAQHGWWVVNELMTVRMPSPRAISVVTRGWAGSSPTVTVRGAGAVSTDSSALDKVRAPIVRPLRDGTRTG